MLKILSKKGQDRRWVRRLERLPKLVHQGLKLSVFPQSGNPTGWYWVVNRRKAIHLH